MVMVSVAEDDDSRRSSRASEAGITTERPKSILAGNIHSSKELSGKGILSRKSTKDEDQLNRTSSGANVRFGSEVVVPPPPAASSGPPAAIVDAAGHESLPATCSICLEAPVATIFQPCGHSLACAPCAAQLGIVCPLCQGI